MKIYDKALEAEPTKPTLLLAGTIRLPSEDGTSVYGRLRSGSTITVPARRIALR